MMMTAKSDKGKGEPTPQDAQKDGQSAISQDDPTLELNESGNNDHEGRFPQRSFRSDVLGDQQIAILCDIGDGHWVREKHERALKDLVADGFLEAADGEPVRYKLTGKAKHLLTGRGVGLNEA